MCAIRDDFSGFIEKGAQVYGISRDSTWTHKAFKERENLPQGLLADMKGDVARQYGAWNEAVGLAERMTVIIDKDGVVRYVQHNGLAEPRDQKQAIAAIALHLFSGGHGERPCGRAPAYWSRIWAGRCLDVGDLAVFVNHDGQTLGNPRGLIPATVQLRDIALHVREQRVRQALFFFLGGAVSPGAVAADAENLRTLTLEQRVVVAVGAHFAVIQYGEKSRG